MEYFIFQSHFSAGIQKIKQGKQKVTENLGSHLNLKELDTFFFQKVKNK